MKVHDVMTKKIVCVDKDESLKHVMDLMRKHNITKVPVLEGKQFVGIVTDNMITYKLGSIRKKSVTATRLHASSVTEKNIKTVSSDTEIKEVLKMVGEPGPTMLPIIDTGRLVGVLTKADILPLVTSRTTLGGLMRFPVHTVSSEDRVIHARRQMINHNVARLPVVDHHQLVGMISDMEIAFALASLKQNYALGHQKHQLEELLVMDVMKTPALWTSKSTTATEAAKLMMEHNIGALPILENNTLVGIVTRTDILKTISL